MESFECCVHDLVILFKSPQNQSLGRLFELAKKSSSEVKSHLQLIDQVNRITLKVTYWQITRFGPSTLNA